MTLPPSLIEKGGATPGAAHEITGPIFTIGRGLDCDLVIASPQVSRRHAEVRRDGENYLLVDLSKNGVLLNGERVSPAGALKHGDEIVLPGMTLVFQSDESTRTFTFAAPRKPGLVIDVARAQVAVNGAKVEVTAKEFQALALMDGKRGKLIRKDELAKAVWPEFDGAVTDESIEQLISRLRRKIEAEPAQPRYLATVRGLGYRLEE